MRELNIFSTFIGHDVQIPEHLPHARVPERDPELRQPGFDDEYDYRTLWFEVFQSGPHIRLEGPRLLNLKAYLDQATWILDGIDVTPNVQLQDRGHAQDSIIRDAVGKHLSVHLPDNLLEIQVGPDHSDFFEGQFAIYTKSKNNRLNWISDWLKFYVAEHGVTAALIYDNGSDAYTCHQLLETMQRVPGIGSGAVIDWPYKFGPQAGPAPFWDSDYYEFVVSSDAQHRFLNRCAGVINADIDELVLTDDRRTIFEHAADSETGFIRYRGRWITGRTLTQEPTENYSFADFGYYDPRAPLETPKWCCIPKRVPDDAQWRTHLIHGLPMDFYDRALHRHFFPISTSWKYPRNPSSDGEAAEQIDKELRHALQRTKVLSQGS